MWRLLPTPISPRLVKKENWLILSHGIIILHTRMHGMGKGMSRCHKINRFLKVFLVLHSYGRWSQSLFFCFFFKGRDFCSVIRTFLTSMLFPTSGTQRNKGLLSLLLFLASIRCVNLFSYMIRYISLNIVKWVVDFTFSYTYGTPQRRKLSCTSSY